MKTRIGRRARAAGGVAMRNAVGSLGRGASAAAFELLEARQLLSAAPAVNIAGPANTNEGSTYSLNLSSSNLGSLSISQWTINWGDGQSTVPGNATVAQHIYDDGPNSYSITADATMSDGSVLVANIGSTTVGNGLDSTFGPGGTVLNNATGESNSNSIAQLSNGQFIVAGSYGTNAVALVRYNANGTVDTTFGTAGTGVAPVTGMSILTGVYDQQFTDPITGATDERVVVVGTAITSNTYQEVVERFNLGDATHTAGSLDTSFGSNGVVKVAETHGSPVGAGHGDLAIAAGIDASGNVVIVGSSATSAGAWLTVTRLSAANGALDTSFNSTGQESVSVNGSATNSALIFNALNGKSNNGDSGNVLFNSNGTFIVPFVGGGTAGMDLAEFNSGGGLVSSFGSAGVSNIVISNVSSAITFYSAALDNSGNIILGGFQNGSTLELALARVNGMTGAIDTSFGSGVNQTISAAGVNSLNELFNTALLNKSGGATGVIVTYLNQSTNYISSLAVTASGQIIAGGVTTAFNTTGREEFAVLRFNADGTLDTGFGDLSDGLSRVAITSYEDVLQTMVAESNGQILIAGNEQNIPGNNTITGQWELARLGPITNTPPTPITVAVANVAPAASISASSNEVAEGSQVSFTASVSDPSNADTAAGFSELWQVTDNGVLYTQSSGLNDSSFAFTPDDNGTYVVTFTATDKDGGVSTPVSQTITVDNVAPTPAFTGTVPSDDLEGSPLSFGGTATDPSTVDTAAGLALSWSVTQDGNAYATGSGSSFTFTPDDNGSYLVTLTATDKDGGSSSISTTVAVANVPPTASFAGAVPSDGLEGTAITLNAAATDPSSVDTAAGFVFNWSVTKDGATFGGGGSGSSFSFTPDDNGSYVVTLTATDKDGGVSAPVTDTIAVANVAPTPAIANPVSSGLEGTAISLSGSATDPSPVDTAAGLSLAWSVTKDGNAFAAGNGANFTFTPDDNGTYVVTLSATDKDGGVGTTTDAIAVANVAPTATIANPVSGGLEGTAISLTGSATDPSPVDTAAGLALSWSVTKNGNAFASSGAGSGFTFTPDDNGTYVVTLSAMDKDGGVGTTTDTITVANVAPTPTIANPVSSGLEGSSITLNGLATDPSSVDTAAGLALAWAVTKNGAAYAAGSGASFTFTPNDNATYVVTLSATDKDGGVGTASDTINVLNVVPTATPITGTTLAVRYQTVSLASTIADPGTLDTHTVTWNFGDGSAAVTSSLGAGVVGMVSAPSHMYTAAGTYAVTLTVTDKDGGTTTQTANVTIAAVAIEADTDSAETGKTALFVGGTNGLLNAITVVPGTSSQGLIVTINASVYSGFKPTGRIVVFGGGSSSGDDVIQLASNITLPAELYGGNGFNQIKGGGGPNIIMGGPNIDTLVAGNNRDILIGAGGSDILVGGAGNDLLVAMSTQYDSNPAALEALQREWTRTDVGFAQIVSDISNGGGLNGNVVLTAGTTENDGAPDLLYGGAGSDEFVISNGDIVLDPTGQDKVVDLSWVTTS